MVLDQVCDTVDAAVKRTVIGAVGRTRTEVDAPWSLTIARDVHGVLHELADAFVLCRRDGNHGHAKLALEQVNVDGAAIGRDLVHHVEGDDHRSIELHKLEREVEVALDIGGVDDVDHRVGLRLENKLAAYDFLSRIRRERVDAGQVGDRRLGVVADLAIFTINRHAREIAHMLAGARKAVEERCLIACLLVTAVVALAMLMAVTAATTALVTVAVLVTMASASAGSTLGLYNLAGKEGIYDVVAIACRAGEDIDAGLSESANSPAADATADEHVNATRCKHAGKGAMTGTVRAYHLRRYNLTILNVVDLELLRTAKVLENLTVFVRDCNPHAVLLLVRPSVCVRLRSRVVCNVSTRDDKTTTVDQSICDLGMSAAANHGDRGARNAHALSGFCLAQLLQVD